MSYIVIITESMSEKKDWIGIYLVRFIGQSYYYNNNIKLERGGIMKEISRRSMYNAEVGMACGPIGITSIDAEIAVEDNGETIYLHGQWVDLVGDEILYEATKESIYYVYEKINKSGDDYDEHLAERDRIEADRIRDIDCYEPYFKEIKQMILDEMEAHGIDGYFECLDDEE